MLATLAAAVDVVYGGAVAGLWADCRHDENYAHGVLVAPAACWLIWSRRTALAAMPRNRQPAAPSRRAQPWCVPRGQAAVEFFLIRVVVRVGDGPGGERQAVATATDLARRLEPQIHQRLFPARPGQPALDRAGVQPGDLLRVDPTKAAI